MSKNNYEFHGTFNFEDKAAEERIKDLERQLTRLASEYDELEGTLEETREAFEKLSEEKKLFEESNGIDILKEKLKKFQNTASQSTAEFRAFLETVRLNNAEGDYDWKFEEYFQKMQEGLMTYNQAILEVKENYASLIEENYNASNGFMDAQTLQTLTASLNRVSEVCETILDRIRAIEEEGVKTFSSSGGSGVGNISRELENIQSSLSGMSQEGQDAYEPMAKLFESITQYASIDETKLYRVSEAFRNIASMGQGHYGAKSIDSIVRLVQKLSALNKSGNLDFKFDAKGFNDLKISKASYANLAEYLPKIARVDSEKLERLSQISFANFNNLKISKGTLQGVMDLTKAFVDLADAFKLTTGGGSESGGGSGSGGSGGAKEDNPLKKQLERDLQTVKEFQKIRNELIKESSRNPDFVSMGRDEDGKWNGLFRFGKDADEFKRAWADVSKAFADVTSRYEILKNKTEELKASGLEEPFNKLVKAMENVSQRSDEVVRKNDRTAQSQLDNLRERVNTYYNDMKGVADRDPVAGEMLKELRQVAESGSWDQIKDKWAEVRQYIRDHGLNVETWFQKMVRTFGARVRSVFAATVVGFITRTLREIYTNVVDIDSAMTQLKIVTSASDVQMEKFLKNSTKLAKELGATIKDVLSSVETFSRLGYGLEDATALAKYASILSKVADVSSDEATKGLTSIIKGYGFDPSDAEHIADVLIQVGQKYAVSASELMEAYSKSGAALNATNTSFEKSAGLIAAANASIQDASVVGTALKTVSARIRKSKTDLDELGESADDLTQSWSTYAREIQALTGVNIMVEGSTTEFKDLYDMFDGLAAKWNELGDNADTTRARVAEILGGTRQYQVISSILANWEDASGAFNDALASAGTSSKALATYIDSVQGKIAQLKATFSELSTNVLSSDIIKLGVDALKVITGIINSVAKLINDVVGLKGALIAVAAIYAVFKRGQIASQITKIQNALVGLIQKLWEAYITGTKFTDVMKSFFSGTQGMVARIGLIAAAYSILNGIFTKIAQRAEEAHENIIQEELNQSKTHQQTAQDLSETGETLEALIEKYKELAGSDDKPLDEIKSVQTQIVNLVGDQAKAIDLVNGKLNNQLSILEDITEENRKQALIEAKSALTDAEAAVLGKGYNLGTTKRNNQQYFELQGLSHRNDIKYDYSKLKTKRGSYDTTGNWFWEDAARFSEDALGPVMLLETEFETAEEFAQQYEAVLEYKNFLAKNIDLQDKNQKYLYDEVNDFLSYFKEVYDNYSGAKGLYDVLFYGNEESTNETGTVKGIGLEAKTVAEILEEIQDKYDNIVTSMEDMNDQGVLSVKTFQSMVSNKLLDYLTQTEDGFVLNEGALEDYVAQLIEAYSAESRMLEMTEDEKEIAISNLKNLRTALAMLALSTDQAKAAANARKKMYEDEKDALNDQLDAYKELIDLRKDLLKQYKEELDYKKELEKKEQKVASLQTQLAVSQLDNSAAGRARTRQIAADLQAAQEELDDFTLEHAIDVVTSELDSQYEEYKKLIDEQLKAIEEKIEELSGASSLGDVSQNIINMADKVTAKIDEAYTSQKNTREEATRAAQTYIDEHKMTEGDRNRWGQDKAFRELLYSLIAAGGSINDLHGYEIAKTGGGGGKKVMMKYHSGGIVGGFANLKSTEEFAKLLKGEFVSTPAMMSKFMSQTLPGMIASGGRNEFNAPLVSIVCDTVSKESMPILQKAMDEAVNVIKKELDNGMLRSGYRKSAKQIAI